MEDYKKLILQRPCQSIFLIALALFMALQYKPAVLNYTTRFVDFADYMLQHGMTLFPIADDLQPYPDYTIANTVLVYLASLPFGQLSVLSMGLPFCIAASLMLVFIYKLGALHERKWGLCGVLFALFTWAFVDSVNSLALDIYPALITAGCFYLAYSADLKQQRGRLALVFLGLILGFALRGPIGMIGPALVVGSYYLLSRQWRTLVGFSLVSGLLFAAGVALLAWAAHVQGGDAFMQQVLEMQGLGRIASDHSPRYYFYFSAGLITYSFTAFYALCVMARSGRQWLGAPSLSAPRLLLHLGAWFVVLIVFFTIPNSKKARYVLSITPAISLLAAYIFIDPNGLFSATRRRLLRLCLNLPAIGAFLALLVLGYNSFAARPLQPDFAGVFSSFALLSGVRYWIGRQYTGHRHYEVIVLAFGVAAFLLLDGFFFNAITYHLELAKEPTPKFLPYWFW
ncbi:4-amino-4-deoxy-L-arabinose transferase-like glycosyltransferase [Pseudomonas protegens]|jgi:4-amino-4-deoxy-L-arabinose transferase-like glycosyltransferase|nr:MULTISPECIES: glycosyltransferase family 39 protein [Pseudomonas]MCS4259473.1 4-amino-4-deoxy-L-arabinose transferase-like glycosyltransferase [Pseudomonas sp. BIGb0176]GED74032.1 hypothetical protein PFL02_08820 [Pseudomonas fluorescens]AGL84572.1 putative membrane protein [Pseudomonas protegens CHA0]AQT09624.1 glycosyltransferase [Pseudomonas protegens]MBP5119680.1 glycosyltransferase family 39 protein [Pseudomonas protegens]